MHIAFRSLATLLLAAGVVTCSDAPTMTARPQFGGGREHIAFEPVFSPTAAAAYANRADFNISFDNVRIVIVRPVADTVKDTTIVFGPGQPDLTVDLDVEVRSVDEVFDASMDYRSGTSVVFHGQGKVQAHPAGEPGKPPRIMLQYTGAGATATRLAVSPKTANLTAPNTATFTVSAFDANNNSVSVPVTWSVSDPTIASIAVNGSSVVVTPGAKRGTVTVTAQSITGLTDNASVTIALPPSSMVLVSGGGQTGKVGSSLAQPAVVKVLATDNQGVAGVAVTFATPTGGAVGSTTVVTDANGQAQTSLTLGTAAGPQSFAAAATAVGGALSVAIPATATPGDPASIIAAGGAGQQDTVKHALKSPFVAKVSDQYGNAVPNVVVSWARTAGTGSLSGTSSTTNSDGLASIGYTLGAQPGPETVTASVSGVASPATFGAQAIPAGPAGISIAAGDAQSGRVLQPLGAPFVVRVTDETGSPVPGVLVTWTAVNGTIASASTTDANGQASATLTLGSVVGNNASSATASITTPTGPKTVTFHATVQPGIVARLVFKTQPTSGTIGKPLSAVQIGFLDVAGNPVVAGNTVTIALGANPSNATLAGTLTQTGVAGTATFGDLTVSAAGTGYTLVASSPGLPNLTSSTFDVGTTQGASQLLFVDAESLTPLASPPSITTPAGLVPGFPAIRSVDAARSAVPNVPITISIFQNTQTVFSTTTATDGRGVFALNSSLLPSTLFQTAGTYSIVVTSSAIAGATLTLPLTVTAGAAAALRFTASPTAGVAGAALTPPSQIAVVDQFGNLVTSATDSIVVQITQGTGDPNATLTGTHGGHAAGGVLTLGNMIIDRPGTGYTLTAIAAGRTSTASGAFPVTAGAGARFIVTASPASPSPSGTSVVTAQLVDASNNPVATPAPRTVTWTVTGSGAVNPTTSTTNASGAATTTFTASTAPGTVTATGDPAANNATGFVVITPLVPAQVASMTPVVAAVADPVQSWPAASYPSVRVLSASSTPVPNVPVTFIVTSGGCFTPSEAPSTVTTDANGVAALSAATITIPRTNEGSCRITASAGSLVTNLAVVVAPATGIMTWTGATSNAWNVGTNWLSGSVPTAADSVFVPGWTLRQPVLATSTTISGLRLEFDGLPFVDVANSVLTINGDLITFGSSSAIMATGSGSVVFNKPTAGILSGLINAPVSIGAQGCTSSYSVASPGGGGTTGLLTGPLTVNCPLTIQRAVVSVNGSAVIQGNGKLIMSQTGSEASDLTTTGDITFNGADETGSITGSSTIIIGGNMTVGPSPNAFVASPTTAQTFQTAGNHTITVVSGAAPVFGQLFVASTGSASTLTVNGSLTADAINISDGALLVSSGTITTAQAFEVGSGSYSGVNTLVITGPVVPNLATSAPVRTVLTNAAAAPTADVAIAGAVEVQGTLNIIHNVTVNGNFSVTGANGELVMQSDDTHLTISGNATFAGKTATRLTNGILQVGGNFIQSGAVSPQSFAASGGHLTVFASTTGIKTVTFATPDSISLGGSAFSAVQVAAGGGIDVGSNLIVTGMFTNSGQVQFLTTPVPTQIGTMFFRDNSRTVVQGGATVNINGPAQFDSTNVIVQLLGGMSAQSCIGPAPSGATFCFGH